MNAWVRMYSVVKTDGGDDCLTLAVSSQIYIVIHCTEQAARAAAAKLGGLVMEINLSALKGASDFDDISLNEADENTEEDKANSLAFVSIACDAVPYQMVRNGDHEYIDLLPEGEAFVESVSKAVGLSAVQ